MGSKHTASSKLGGRRLPSRSWTARSICHPQVVSRLKHLAAERGIPAQMDIIQAGGTDAGAIHTTRIGVLTGGVSVPCRYIHTPQEMVDRGDVEACARLIAAFAEAQI